MIRSILSVPGHKAEMVAKARTRGADLIAWDLEDSVPEGRKREALRNVYEAFAKGDAVRINRPLDDEEIAFMVGRSPGYINVPKVEDCDVIEDIRSTFGSRIPILAVIESPRGVLNAAKICRDADAVAFGRADFCAAVGQADPESLIAHAMGQIAIAAHAAGIPAYDSPCEVLDGAAMLYEVSQAAAFGFTGKICIHPEQIPACAHFAPNAAEVSKAELLAAWKGTGGRLVAEPHYRLAEKIRRAS